MEKCCANCRWFDFEKSLCRNTSNFENYLDNNAIFEKVQKALDDGDFDEIVDQYHLDAWDFDMYNTKKILKELLDYDNYKKVINIMTNDLNDGIDNANAEIDSRFTDELNNNLDFSSDVGIIIKEPKEFCCSNYL